MKLSLVVPCYNEEKNVSLFYKAVKKDFASVNFDYEIVYVNDGSKDGTLKELKKLLSGDIPIKIVNFSRNFGKESAMFAGLQNSEGDYVSIIDADLQQRPAIVLEMVNTLESNPDYDCVAAYQNERSENKLQIFLKDSFYKVINKIADCEFKQGASDFRTFRRPMVEAILNMGEYFRFSKGLFSWVGYNTLFIPYKADDRATGESKWSIFKLFAYALEGIYAFTTFPLKISYIAGGFLFLIALLYALISFIGHIGFNHPYSIVFPVLFWMFVLSGVILVCLGLIGDYLARVYIQTKGRPIYIAKEILKNDKY